MTARSVCSRYYHLCPAAAVATAIPIAITIAITIPLLLCHRYDAPCHATPRATYTFYCIGLLTLSTAYFAPLRFTLYTLTLLRVPLGKAEPSYRV